MLRQVRHVCFLILTCLSTGSSSRQSGYNMMAYVVVYRMIPKLFFGIDNPLQDPVAAKAKECTTVLLNTVMDDWAARTTALSHSSTAVKPFDQVLTNLTADCTTTTTESALSRVVTMVVRHLIQSVCRQVTVSWLRNHRLLFNAHHSHVDGLEGIWIYSGLNRTNC